MIISKYNNSRPSQQSQHVQPGNYKIETWEILKNNITKSTRGKFWGTILQDQNVGNSGEQYYKINTWEILGDNITRSTRGKFRGENITRS